MPSRIRSLSLGLSLALALCGCVPTEDVAEPPRPTVTPVFASGEEALAAATEAYARFVEVVEAVGHDGGLGAERLAEVTTRDFLAQELAAFEQIQAKGQRMVGDISFRDVKLQQYSYGPEDVVVVYLCEDITEVALLDDSGTSVSSPERPDTNYFEVSFDLGETGDLLISNLRRWDDRKC